VTLPRKKSRPIDIDGVPYRWMVRETLWDGVMFVVMAQRADGKGPRLHAVLVGDQEFGYYASGCRHREMTPGHIAHWVRAFLRRPNVDWMKADIYQPIPSWLRETPTCWPAAALIREAY
jgi:hypothetical protein